MCGFGLAVPVRLERMAVEQRGRYRGRMTRLRTILNNFCKKTKYLLEKSKKKR